MPDPIRSSPLPLQSVVSDDRPPEAKAPPSPPGQTLSPAARQLADKYSAGAASTTQLGFLNRPKAWYADRLLSEAACLLPGELPFRAAMQIMPENGLAQSTLRHFLSGSSAPVRVDLDAELARNPQLRQYVASRIETDMAESAAAGVPLTEMSGSVWVPQSAYGDSTAGKDQQFALGGTFVEYQVSGSAADGGLELRLNVADHYFWSPSESNRPTHCLHELGASLVAARKAVEFYQVGEGTLIVPDPTQSEAMAPLEAQAKDDG